MNFTLGLHNLLFLGICVNLPCQMSWQMMSVSIPTPRYSTVAAFDNARGVGVLFGGRSATSLNSQAIGLGDTWIWDGQWTLRTPATVPPARLGHSMAFDRARGMVVMAMGSTRQNGGVYLSDVWTWNGVNWAMGTPTVTPPARRAAAMAYDDQYQVCRLFGGEYISALGDTWEWNGLDWTQVVTAHAPVPHAAGYSFTMEHDPARGRCVLLAATSNGYTQIEEHWEWFGGDWQQLANPPFTPRTSPTMFYDRGRQRMVVSCGGNYWGALNDTWEFDGVAWSQVPMASPPPPRSATGNFYDEWRGHGVMYSGYHADTWFYSGPSPASVVAYAPGCPGSGGTPAITVVHRPILGDTYEIHVNDLAPNAIAFMMTGWAIASIHIGAVVAVGNGCYLRVSPDAQTPMIGTNSYTIAVPADPIFLGVALHNQAIQAEINGTALTSISVSNAVRMVMGNP